MKRTSSAGRVPLQAAPAPFGPTLKSRRAAFFVLAASCASLIAAAAQAATYNVKTGYGAKGDGSTVDTTAINNAVTAANAAGGGIVEFPSGTYKTGSIHLKSNVTLQLDSGSVIQANSSGIDAGESNAYSSYQDYGHSHFHDALIWGESLTNIGITGPGTIDGNGNLKTSQPSSGQGDKAVCLRECNGVVLSDFTIKKGGWFGLLTNGTNNIVMTNVKILDSDQRDAFDLINSQHVDISNCDIEGSDDSMCLKADYALGRKVQNTDIHVDNCTILSASNNAVQFGSETVGDFSNCTFSHLTITGAGKAGLGVTSNDGAIIDGVTFSDITLTNCVTPIWLKITNNHRAPNTPPPGRIRNISFLNITSTNQPSGAITSTVEGCGTVSPAIPIENVVFNNVKLTVPGGQAASAASNVPPTDDTWQPRYLGVAPSYGFFLRHVKGISFINCQVKFSSNDDRSAVKDDADGQSVKIDGLVAQRGSSSATDISLTGVTGYQVTGSTNTSGAALRVTTSGSSAATVVAPPTFSPAGGTYTSAQSITLASTTSGASIRYTTDGSTPTATSGNIYSGPFTVSADAIVKAIASASGATDSAVDTAVYQIGSSSGGSGGSGGGSPVSFEAENITYVATGGTASVQTDANSSGGKWVQLAGTATGQYIDYTLPSVPAGTYALSLMWKGNTSRGTLTVTVDGTAVGGTLDQYSATQIYPTTALGTVTFSSAGSHTIRLTVAGKNASSSAYNLSADLFTLTPQ